MKYKTEWKPNSLNVDYWQEVLVDRKITKLVFDDSGIKSFELDNGEVINLHAADGTATLMIKSEL